MQCVASNVQAGGVTISVTGYFAARSAQSTFRYRTQGTTGSKLMTVSTLNWRVLCVQVTSVMKEHERSVLRGPCF